MTNIRDFMVRSPVIEAPWHPLSYVRQAMLTGSFSFLTVSIPEVDSGAWRLISDVALARALRADATRKDRLAMPLNQAVLQGIGKLDIPRVAYADSRVEDVAADLTAVPVLVAGSSSVELLGILTAFNLLWFETSPGVYKVSLRGLRQADCRCRRGAVASELNRLVAAFSPNRLPVHRRLCSATVLGETWPNRHLLRSKSKPFVRTSLRPNKRFTRLKRRNRPIRNVV